MTTKNIKLVFIIAIGLMIFAFFAPWLFTRPARFQFLDFSSMGQIGDTIGGTTAPIIGIINAFLVYFALKAQIEANAQIQKQILEQEQEKVKEKNIALIRELYKYLKEDMIEKFNDKDYIKISTIISNMDGGTTGKDDSIEDVKKLYNPYYEFCLLLETITLVIDKVNNEDIYDTDRQLFKILLNTLLDENLFIHYDRLTPLKFTRGTKLPDNIEVERGIPDVISNQILYMKKKLI